MKLSLEKIKQRILSIKELPTLPTVAMEVMALTSNPDSAINDIVNVIQNDPSITTKILKIANSSFYGMRQRIDTINRALVILGMNEVNNLVTSVAVFKTFPVKTDKPTFDRLKFWEHCAVTGEVAKAMSVKMGMKLMGTVFTAGLLHDIGKIILDEYFHDEFNTAYELSYEKKIPLYEAEKEIFGVTHPQIGGWVAEKWKLPNNLIDAIMYHHKPVRSLNHKVLTSIVSIANIFSKAADSAFSGEELGVVMGETEAWKIMTREYPKIKNIDLEKFTFELEEYAQNAREFMSIVSAKD